MSRLSHWALLGALAWPAATAMAADIPGDASTRARLAITPPSEKTRGVLESKDDVDWHRVRLEEGVDYAVSGLAVEIAYPLGLRDRRGRVLGSANPSTSDDDGFEVRAPATGDFFVTVGPSPVTSATFPGDYLVAVSPDCRGDRTTACRLRTGKAQRRSIAFPDDHDWFRINLSTGGIYDFSLPGTAGGDLTLVIRDTRGRELARTSDADDPIRIPGFRPRRSGPHFVEVFSDGVVEGNRTYEIVVVPVRR